MTGCHLCVGSTPTSDNAEELPTMAQAAETGCKTPTLTLTLLATNYDSNIDLKLLNAMSNSMQYCISSNQLPMTFDIKRSGEAIMTFQKKCLLFLKCRRKKNIYILSETGNSYISSVSFYIIMAYSPHHFRYVHCNNVLTKEVFPHIFI